MVKEVPELPSGDRGDMWLKMDELLTWNPQSDVAKPYPPRRARPGFSRTRKAQAAERPHARPRGRA